MTLFGGVMNGIVNDWSFIERGCSQCGGLGFVELRKMGNYRLRWK